MGAGFEELAKMFSGLRDRLRIGYADAIEAERAGFVRERGLEVDAAEFDGLVQKSRST